MAKLEESRVPTEEITRERFQEWAALLEPNHATPAFLIGIGHDETTGEIHVCYPEETSWMRISFAFYLLSWTAWGGLIPSSRWPWLFLLRDRHLVKPGHRAG